MSTEIDSNNKHISTEAVNQKPMKFLSDLENVIKQVEPMVEKYCGRCVPCRIGNKRLLEKLIKLRKGRVSVREINSMIDLSNKIIEASLCPLGKNEPKMVLDLIDKYFIVND